MSADGPLSISPPSAHDTDIAAWWFRLEHGRLPRAGELDDDVVVAEWEATDG